MLTYCLKCKKKKKKKKKKRTKEKKTKENAKNIGAKMIKTKNGRLRLSSKCVVCGSKN